MTAQLIISFDCEGKWGIADRGEQRQRSQTRKSLTRAYSSLLDVFRKFEAPATFAFVSAFCLEKDQLAAEVESSFEIMRYGDEHWLEPACTALRAEKFEGWSEPELLHMVKSESQHHICSHSGFHIPYDEDRTPAESIDTDIRLIRRLDSILGQKQNILVFPRNKIGYRERLSGAGFSAYREADKREQGNSVKRRIERLLLEYAAFDRGDMLMHKYVTTDGMLALSPGKFLNASIGLRACVPIESTKRRIDTMLRYSVTNQTIVHFYSHPHNVIDDPTLIAKFDYLLARATELRDADKMKISTMGDELDGVA